MKTICRVLLNCLCYLTVSVCFAVPEPDPNKLPLYPANIYEDEIQAVDFNENYTAPFIPAHRTTADGRIAVPMTGGRTLTYFLLNVPEKLDEQLEPFINGVAGTEIIARNANGTLNKESFEIDEIVNGNVQNEDLQLNHSFGMKSICDATSQFPEYPTSPKSCTYNNNPADCYTFTLTTSFNEKNSGGDFIRTAVYGRDIEIVVTNPKSKDARIVDSYWVGQPVKGLEFQYNPLNAGAPPMLEPTFTNDGKIFVFRTGPLQVNWDDNGTGKTGTFNMMYAVAPETATSCDMSAFNNTRMAPLSHAYHDDDLKDQAGGFRYGFAEYPIRDPQGNVIQNGDDMQATYPWIDRSGANMMIETVGATLYYPDVDGNDPDTRKDITPRFVTRCADGTTNPSSCTLDGGLLDDVFTQNGAVEWKGKKRGLAIFGRWTRGKIVLLDGLVNNTDYGLGQEADRQRQILLYKPDSDRGNTGSGYVNAGFGQSNNISTNMRNLYGVDQNASFIDSFENLFSYRESFIPYSPRDIAWLVTSGRTTAEVSFDDYIDHSAYIVSEMTASQQHGNNVNNFTTDPMTLYDGFDDDTSDYNEPIRVQNAATTTKFAIPDYGVANGRIRIEPIAMGGIEGRGVFFHDSNDYIQYSIPENNSSNDWIISLFIDPRFGPPTSSTKRRLITYPDGSQLDIVGRNTLEFSKTTNGTNSGVLFSINTNQLPYGQFRYRTWNQIGLLVENAGTDITVFIDGLPVATHNGLSTPLFRLETTESNELIVGQGFRGWLDDFKVFAHGGNLEYMCNLARGTRVQYSDSSISCFHDYTDQNLAHVHKLPADATVLKDNFHFPEGPLLFGQSRPDSRNNQFCLTCHTNDNSETLDIDTALAPLNSVVLENDTRRQPMQPPRNVYGHIPSNFFMTNIPVAASNDGVKLDAWVYPSGGSEATTPPAAVPGEGGPGPNLLTNPSFVDDTNGWEFGGDSSINTWPGNIYDNDGKAAKVVANQTWQAIRQKVEVTPNKTYRFSGAMKAWGQSGGAESFIKVKFYNNSTGLTPVNYVIRLTDFGALQLYTEDFVAPPNATDVEMILGFNNVGSGNAVFDALSIQQLD